MMIHKISPFVDYNQQLKRMNTQLNERTNPLKSTTVVKQTNNNYKTLGTSVINFPLFPLSLYNNSTKQLRKLRQKFQCDAMVYNN